MIKRFILAAVIAVSLVGGATVAYARCYTEEYFVNGKYTNCTVCIDSSGNRTTTCF